MAFGFCKCSNNEILKKSDNKNNRKLNQQKTDTVKIYYCFFRVAHTHTKIIAINHGYFSFLTKKNKIPLGETHFPPENSNGSRKEQKNI